MIIKYFFRNLSLELDLPDLYSIILRSLRRIPKGKVITYKALALALGDRIAARAIGYIMKKNPYPEIYPCYKVVSTTGGLGGYSRGINKKIEKLQMDGIEVMGKEIPNLDKYLVEIETLNIPRALESLQRLQNTLSRSVLLEDQIKKPKLIATFDLSYIDGPPDISIGVGCVYNLREKAVSAIGISILPVLIPYIPSYLAFRELPAILGVIDLFANTHLEPDLLILDGQGILHPRRFGIASHIGVLTGIPSIGVAKSILVGKTIVPFKRLTNGLSYAPIIYNDEIRGFEIRNGTHRIIVSPGHRVSLDTARDFIAKLDWPKSEAEPWIIRLPHKIATTLRRILKHRLEQKETATTKKKRNMDLTRFLGR